MVQHRWTPGNPPCINCFNFHITSSSIYTSHSCQDCELIRLLQISPAGPFQGQYIISSPGLSTASPQLIAQLLLLMLMLLLLPQRYTANSSAGLCGSVLGLWVSTPQPCSCDTHLTTVPNGERMTAALASQKPSRGAD